MGNLSVKGKFQGVSTLDTRLVTAKRVDYPSGTMAARSADSFTENSQNQEHLVHSILQESDFIIFISIHCTRAFDRFCKNRDLFTDN